MSHFIKSVPNTGDPIYHFAYRLLAVCEKRAMASGTCVKVCTNLVLTAKHVFLDFDERFGHGQYQLWILQITNDQKICAIWEGISAFTLSQQTDLLLMNMRPYDQTSLDLLEDKSTQRQPVVKLSSPEVGAIVTAFGFSSNEKSTRVQNNTTGGLHFEINDEPTVTQGVVREIYPVRRDTSMLNFPSFRIDFESRGGMSGGPVFDEQGRLCGIISSGVQDNNIAYASSLGPLMDIPIDLYGLGPTTRIHCSSLREAVKYGFVSVTH